MCAPLFLSAFRNCRINVSAMRVLAENSGSVFLNSNHTEERAGDSFVSIQGIAPGSRSMCEGAVKRVSKSMSLNSRPQPKRPMDAVGKRFTSKHRFSPAFLSWRPAKLCRIVQAHPLLILLSILWPLMVPLEYNLTMVAPGGEAYDAGFVVTDRLHKFLKENTSWHHLLAAANTVLVVFQILYIAWVWAVEGRFRPTLASAFMYSSRGFLGYSTQLPLPKDFLDSAVDFPVGDYSFFLFFSGHVGASVICSLDLRDVNRMRGALLMDTLNVLQMVRLLASRGHYTIDLVIGAFAGWACYYVAGLYEERMKSVILMSSNAVVPDADHSDSDHPKSDK
uniref:AtPDCT1/2 transmembrane domain-containing protein n=1 Tax=Physcomitrium patens TaxID=3218 RepID=A0A7I4C4M6_PHYPA